MAALLSKAAILAAEDRPHADVEVPEWGGVVRLRALSSADRVAVGTKIATGKDSDPVALTLAYAIVDEAGDRVFTDDEVAELSRKSGEVCDRLFGEVSKLSKLGREGIDAGKPRSGRTRS